MNKQKMKSKKEKGKNREEILKRTNEDVVFQGRLEKLNPTTLAMWISMGTQGQNDREWLINYLDELEEFLEELGIVEDDETKDLIFQTVKGQIIKHEAEFGTAELNPKRLDTWTHEIANLADEAQIHAKFGRDREALNTLFYVLREGFRCLEFFIDQQVEIGIPGLEEAIKRAVGKPDKKTTDPADTEPAE